MDAAPPPGSLGAGVAVTCDSCGRKIERHAYEFRVDDGTGQDCLTCALRRGPLVRRSLMVAIVVGTLLAAINQGNVVIGGDFPDSLAWKIPLTYTVPYCVATFGAIMNARKRIIHG